MISLKETRHEQVTLCLFSYIYTEHLKNARVNVSIICNCDCVCMHGCVCTHVCFGGEVSL